jgi:hypothetical protein
MLDVFKAHGHYSVKSFPKVLFRFMFNRSWLVGVGWVNSHVFGRLVFSYACITSGVLQPHRPLHLFNTANLRGSMETYEQGKHVHDMTEEDLNIIQSEMLTQHINERYADMPLLDYRSLFRHGLAHSLSTFGMTEVIL